MKQRQNLLGIVIYEQALAVCQVERSGNEYSVQRSGVYPLPEGITPENLSAASAGFKEFLREKGLKSKNAVVGISAKHILSTCLHIPPIQDAQVRYETLKLNLEKKLEVENTDIVFDYNDQANDNPEGVLVMITLRKLVSQIKELLTAARLIPTQITSLSLGLDLVKTPSVTCNIVELPDAFELCLFQNGNLKSIQHLRKKPGQSLDVFYAQKIICQVSRVYGIIQSPEETIHYYIWSHAELSDSLMSQMRQIFGTIEYRRLKESSDDQRINLTAELTGRAVLGKSGPINFLNGHHTEVKPTFIKRQLSRIIAAAAVFLILAVVFILSWQSNKWSIAQLQEQLEEINESVEAADKLIDQVNCSRPWFLQEPRYLEILRELSLSFPNNEDVWLTSLAVDESFNQILTGRTVREDAILDVVETLRSRDYFDDIKILYIRKAGKGADVMTFAINLQKREGK